MSNDMRLNNDYRKSLITDFRSHAEQEYSILKEEYLQSIVDCDEAVAKGFAMAKQVVERAFNPSDVTTLRALQNRYSTIDSVAKDSCFYLKVIDEENPNWLETENRRSYHYNSNYNDDENSIEVSKEKHFDFELNGSYSGSYREYGSTHKSFAYAYYRDDLKGQGLNPDILVEQKDKGSNPHLHLHTEKNDSFLVGKKFDELHWKGKYALDIIGSGGCRSRAIKCTQSEFDMCLAFLHSKQAVVQAHEKWIESVIQQTDVVKNAIQSYKQLSSVKELADTLGWAVNEHILSQKGTDLVISNPDSIKSMLDNIKGVKQTREDKILAVMKYNKEQALVS